MLLLVAQAAALVLRGDGLGPGRGAPAAAVPVAAVAAADRFLDGYVAEDGRVVRHDQGGDTVSEGQAYALLAAVGTGDRTTFDRVWRWTVTNLRRPDGLLSWRWVDGTVVDHQPATDADLDAAWALALAAARWADPTYGDEAAALATAVVGHEVGEVDGERVLLAGPWAGGDEPVLNPSYASPAAVEVLRAVLPAATATALDDAVDGLVDLTAEVVGPSDLQGNVGEAAAAEEGTGPAAGVAPDWVLLTDGGAEAVRGPVDHRGGRFGWDAVRVPVRLAAGCDATAARVAAAHWPAIEAGAGIDRLGDHPARLVGAAAAAAAAGEEPRAVALLEEAAGADERSSTYYGAALVAVGRLLLETGALGGCSPIAA